MGRFLGRKGGDNEFPDEEEAIYEKEAIDERLKRLETASLGDLPALLGFNPGKAYYDLRRSVIDSIREKSDPTKCIQEINGLINGQKSAIADGRKRNEYYVGFLIDSALIWQELGRPDMVKRALLMVYAFVKEYLSGAIADIVLKKINQFNG